MAIGLADKTQVAGDKEAAYLSSRHARGQAAGAVGAGSLPGQAKVKVTNIGTCYVVKKAI